MRHCYDVSSKIVALYVCVTKPNRNRRRWKTITPARILEYILLLVLVVGFAYVAAVVGFRWSYAAGIVIPIVIAILLFFEDQDMLTEHSRGVKRL